MTEHYYYRAEVMQYCIADGGAYSPGDFITTPRLTMHKYRLLKKTPKGAWLDCGLGDKRFVLDAARKRFACPTEKEALESLVARKKAHVRHAEARAAQARLHLKSAERELQKLEAEAWNQGKLQERDGE